MCRTQGRYSLVVVRRVADTGTGRRRVLATQTANTRSLRLAAELGFTEVERFRAWEAEQWLGLRPAASV
ncbi:hypothetical protein SUDANB13_00110 [Streptomyces sp. enrichment culture]